MSLSDNIANKGGSVVTNADCEVQKLKDLVKKLERQNQHLRYKTGKLSPHSKSELSSRSTNHEIKTDDDVELKYSCDDCVTESDLLRLSSADETDWLYSSPKAKYSEDRRVLETWLRDELDHPSTPNLAKAKKSIINSLDTPYGYERLQFDSPLLKESSQSFSPKETTEKHKVPSLSNNVPLERRLFSSNDGERDSHGDNSFHSSKPVEECDETPAAYHVHHMPLPSHTMTSVHGLIPIDGSMIVKHRQRSPSPSSRSRGVQRYVKDVSSSSGTRNESPSRRKESPSRRRDSPSRHGESPSRRRESPSRRNESPGRRTESPATRRENSLLNEKSYSQRSQSPSSSELASRRSINRSAPDLHKGDFSSPVSPAPSDQMSKRRSNIGRVYASGLPQASSGYGRTSNSDTNVKQKSRIGRQIAAPSYSTRINTRLVNSESNSEPTSPRSGIARPQGSTPRRSLPRPSQTSRNQYYSQKSEQFSKLPNASGQNSVSEGQQVDDTLSYETKSESSDVWKDGEFF